MVDKYPHELITPWHIGSILFFSGLALFVTSPPGFPWVDNFPVIDSCCVQVYMPFPIINIQKIIGAVLGIFSCVILSFCFMYGGTEAEPKVHGNLYCKCCGKKIRK